MATKKSYGYKKRLLNTKYQRRVNKHLAEIHMHMLCQNDKELMHA